MITIHIVQSGRHYWIEERSFCDPAGLFISLRAKGVTTDNLRKAAEG